MQTTEVTRQTLRQGLEQLIIYHTMHGYHVVHVNVRQHAQGLPNARYDTYGDAHDRLDAELRARQ